jgi:hypothetical protein
VAGVTTISTTGPSVAPIGTNDFRLTLESGVAVSATDQLAKTTLYATPYAGNRIDLYDAAGLPTTIISAQVSIALPAVASQLYDVYGVNVAGVFTLELLAWTNDTTRATAIVQTTTGTYTKSGDLTRRYLGSVRTTAVAGQTEDSMAKRYLWNLSHRVPRVLRVLEATNTWSYATATYRQAGGVATNQLDVVVGVADRPIVVSVFASLKFDTVGSGSAVSIGEDGTTSAQIVAGTRWGRSELTAIDHALSAHLEKVPAVGRHFYAWLEKGSGAGAGTWYGDDGGNQQSGITGWIEG